FKRHESIRKKILLFSFIIVSHLIILVILKYVTGGDKQILQNQIYLPIILIFPFITYFIYELIQYHHLQNKKNREAANAKDDFWQLVENSCNYFIRFKPNGKISYINQSYIDLLSFNDGRESDGYISSILYKENPSIIVDDIISEVRKCRKQLSSVEDIYVGPNNNTLFLMWSFQGIFDVQGTLIEIISMGMDVTPLHELQIALNNNETHLNSIFELAADAILIGNLQGTIIMANKRAAEVSGYTVHELIGQHITSLFNNNDLDSTPFRFDLLNSWQEVRNERKLRKKDGSIVYIEMNTKRMPNGSYSTIIRDNTERQRLENELRASENRYRVLFEGANDTILLLYDYKIVDANRQATDLFGYSKDQLVGRCPWEYSPIHQKGRLFSEFLAKEYIDQAFNGEDLVFEWEHFVKNTESIYCEVKLKRIDINDKSYIQAIIHDHSEFYRSRKLIADKEAQLILQNEKLTEINKALQKSKNKAEESDRLKSAFLANMSHEIRTPLNGILGFCELLKTQEIDTPKAVFFINVIEKSSQQLLSLINDIMHLSKIEAKRETLHYEPFELDVLAEDLYNLYLPMAINKNIYLTLHKRIDQSLIVKSDLVKIKQILGNVINNALKFTAQGGVEFDYCIEQQYVKFEIKDSGIGIPENEIENIFDRFRQVELELGNSTGGTGLGLSICKSLVEMLEGHIRVESVLGEGSKFIVELPLEIIHSDDGIHKLSNKEVAIEKLDLSSKTILVAEDEDINMLLIRNILSECNANIIAAENGAEAVAIVESGTEIDIILMDIKMPVMNGIEAAQKVNELDKEIPIIALTAYAMHQEVHNILQSGFKDIITKPIDHAALFFILKRYLNI
ncbi:MAG: PAS domain S-box protein, partial [Salinivirgaceae bacterium]|nr:PAS domain S-box protein [Salinivirgaceae bacterium]